jgi:O-antigen/teichoic acid export membrane protein
MDGADATQAVNDAPVDPSVPADAARRHIRGSSFLLFGRVMTMALSFATQVLTVRYLSKEDYGAFAWALSVSALGATIAVLGLEKSVGQFIATYQERKDSRRVLGTIVLSVATVLVVSLLVVLLVWSGQGWISGTVAHEAHALPLLLVLIFLTPVDALDSLFIALFAALADPRAIFFRRYVLEPGLYLGVVVLTAVGHFGVGFLANAYLAAGLLGVTICAATLAALMRRKGLFAGVRITPADLPAREVFGFTLPLFSSNLLHVAGTSLMVSILEHFRGAADVAEFRAVLPVAAMNMLVCQSFRLLFTPQAARAVAREDPEGLHSLYWQTALWVAVISFPIFAVTFALAEPVTLLLFGSRYADSALVLTVMALGYYLSAAMTFDGIALRVAGQVRYIVVTDVVSVVVGLGLSFMLVPQFGALGGAIGTSLILILQGLLYHRGLAGRTGIRVSEWRHLRVYLGIAVAAAALFAAQVLFRLPIYAGVPLAAFVSLLLLIANRRELHVERMFPELLRSPLARRFFTSDSS